MGTPASAVVVNMVMEELEERAIPALTAQPSVRWMMDGREVRRFGRGELCVRYAIGGKKDLARWLALDTVKKEQNATLDCSAES